MEPEKNLPTFIPPALLEKAQAEAEQAHVTLDDLVREAIERRVNKREFEEVLTFGKRHAKARGLKPSDVAEAIDAARAESQERGR